MGNAMKNSGVEWIAEIPENWELRPLKFILQERSQKNNPIISEEILSLSIDKGVTLYADKTTNKDRFKEDLTQYKLAYPNDIVVNSMNVIVGAVGKSKYMGCVSPVYYVLYSSDDKKYDIDYYDYIFKSAPLRKVLFSLGRGIMSIEKENDRINTCRLKVSNSDLKRLTFPVPPFQLQQQIANFLDDKCADIDQLITLQQQMIDELKAYKQSVITEAVCKGLDKSVPMKDSGIEWIGEVPEGWKISKVKQLFKVFNGSTPKSDNMDFWGGEITWITPVDMYNNQEIYSSIKTITELGYKSCGTTLLPENSIILSTRAPIGQVSMNKVPLCTNQGCKSLVAKNENNTKYYFYYFQVQTNVLNMLGRGTTFLELSTTDLNNFILPVPGIDEQNIIVSYLDHKSSQIDTLISIKQQKIDELKEYKKSMIYEYITGKKQVPNN